MGICDGCADSASPRAYRRESDCFEIDYDMQHKLLIAVAPTVTCVA